MEIELEWQLREGSLSFHSQFVNKRCEFTLLASSHCKTLLSPWGACNILEMTEKVHRIYYVESSTTSYDAAKSRCGKGWR